MLSISKKLFLIPLLVTKLLTVDFVSTAQNTIPPPLTNADWTKDYEPFRIVGNLYYVGTYDLASYLITTPQGHILINTGLAESVPMIRSHIEALGFKFEDIKILLATHAHFDHVAGMAEIKKLTGAKMMIHAGDAQVLSDGGNSDYVFGGKGKTFEPVKADRLLHEHDTVRLGGTEIIVLHHPGHTKGACSFLLEIKSEQRSWRVLIANMPTILEQTKLSGMPGYPDVAKDYAYTLESLRKIHFDIWLSSHASQFGLHHKRKPGDAYRPESFVDEQGFGLAIDHLQEEYQKKLDDK